MLIYLLQKIKHSANLAEEAMGSSKIWTIWELNRRLISLNKGSCDTEGGLRERTETRVCLEN